MLTWQPVGSRSASSLTAHLHAWRVNLALLGCVQGWMHVLFAHERILCSA